MKQLKRKKPGTKMIIIKNMKEEFTLKNATLCCVYNLFIDNFAYNGHDGFSNSNLAS